MLLLLMPLLRLASSVNKAHLSLVADCFAYPVLGLTFALQATIQTTQTEI